MKKWCRNGLSIMLSVILLLSLFSVVPISAFAAEDEVEEIAAKDESEKIGLESTGYSALDNFINDYRFTNGASWAYNKTPVLASFQAWGCCAYCADYVKYCYGYNNPRTGSVFYNVNEIRAGDVLTVGNQSDGTGHWFVCLKRSGNSLYVAEGNYSNSVRIGWNYTISGSKFAEDGRSFTAGYHYLSGIPDPTPSFTPVDIGTNFYGSIVNLAVNKPIKEAGGNVVCGVRDGSDNQKWKFERQSDTSYKIISVSNGQCLEVAGAGTDDNSNIRTYPSNDTPAQRWYFRYNGSGYSLVPLCAKNLALDLVNGTSNEGNNIAAWTFVENNGNQIYGVDIQPSFSPVDIGTNFYGSIVNLAVNKPIKEAGGNVVCGVRDGSDNQKWKFVRLDDRMYKIISVSNGQCLEIAGAGTTDNSNIRTYPSNDTPAQRWYFRNNGSGFSLVSRCAPNLALDLVDGSSKEGNNIAAWTFVENNRNQIYGVDIQPSFTPQDLGDKFTVNIIHSASESVVSENSDNNVVIQKYNGNDCQLWIFERMDDRMYKITNKSTGRVLDIDNGGITDDTNIHTWTSADNTHQRWYLWKNGNGYSLVPKCSLNLAMDLVGSNTTDGSNLAAWTCVSGNPNQIFTLELKVIRPAEQDIMIGDINGDNSVDVLDATVIQKYAVDRITLTDDQKEIADVNNDGVVDILDATEIQKYAVDKITEFKKKA